MGAYTGTSKSGKKKGPYSSGGTLGSSSKGGGPSVFSRVMDILSRGNYAAAEATKRRFENAESKKSSFAELLVPILDRDFQKGLAAGVTGKSKTSFQDVVPKYGWTKNTNNRLAQGAEGLLYDLLLDPTNLIGAGVGKTAAKGVSGAVDAARTVESADKAGDAIKLADKVTDIAKEAPEVADAIKPIREASESIKHVVPTSDDVMLDTPADVIRANQVGQKVASTAGAAGEVDKTLDLIRSIDPASQTPQMAKYLREAQKALEGMVKPAKKIGDAVSSAPRVPGPPPVGPTMPKGFERAKKIIEEINSGAIKPAMELPPSIVRTKNGALRDTHSNLFVSPKTFKEGPRLPALGLGPIPGKVVPASGTAAKVVSKIDEAAAQPSLFGDALELTSKVPPEAAIPVPKAVTEAADLGTKVPGLTDLGAPVSRALELRIAGKPVIRSEKAYTALADVLQPVSKSAFVQNLSRTFRTGHGMLPEVHNLQRIYSGRGRQTVHAKAQEIQTIFAGTNLDGVEIPKVSIKDQKKIFEHIQAGTVDLLPKELRIPAQYLQVELAKIIDPVQDMLPGMQNAVRFDEIPTYKGSENVFDKAPQAFIAQYDKYVRKQSFEEFRKIVESRFPKDHPEMIANMKKAREVFGVEGETSTKWIHYMNSVQGPWKRWVTSYRPGFHIRNMMGDSFNAFLAGTNPARFNDSAKVLAMNIGDIGAKGRIKMGARTFSPDEVEAFYKQGGLETGFIDTEVVGGSQRGIAHKITEFGERREKFTRLATFIDSMDRGLKRGMTIEKSIEQAAFRVRKYHFDYTDLTPSERKIRTFIPFYTYTRNELPLLLEHTLTQPGKIIAPKKAGSAIETMLGVERDPDDPFPGIEGLLPEYMQDQQIIQRGNNKTFSPGLPTDMLNMLGPRSFIKEQAGGLAPLIKGPLELSTGKSFPLGYDIFKTERDKKGKKINPSSEEQLARYLASYAPYGNLARDSKSTLRERILNILTGVGSRTVR